MACSRISPAHAFALAAVTGLLWSSSARAYCRAVTASPPANFDPGASGCFGYGPDGGTTGGVFPLFWRNQCVSYSFQTGSAPSKYVSLADAKRIAAQAFGAWSNAACANGTPSIIAYNYPEVDCNDVPSAEHNNVIIFRDSAWPYDDAANAIGYTTLTVDLTTGEILGADTEINSAQWEISTDSNPPANGYDLATILTHEAGHFLGLAHSSDNAAVMFAKYHAATVLQPDDVAAICSIYGADGTRYTAAGPIAPESCNATPLAGFLPSSCGSLDAGIANLTVIGSGSGVNSGILDSPCPDVSGCTIGSTTPRSSPWGWRILTGGLVLAGSALGLGRRSRRRRAGVTLGVSLTLLGAAATSEREAAASVSAAALFDDLVKEASAAAVVTPIEQRAIWEGNRIVTLTHVRVDRVVAGQVPEAAWVRTLGGNVGHIGQIVEGQATFALGSASLLFVRLHVDPLTKTRSDAFVVVDSAQGQFPIVASDGRAPRLVRASNVGALMDPLNRTAGARLASDVLADRPLDEAVREIGATWRRVH
jgi:hypothetical protein